MPDTEDPVKSCAFDLMYKDLEISSGAMRVHNHDLLVEKIKKKDLTPIHSTDILQHLNMECHHMQVGVWGLKGSP